MRTRTTIVLLVVLAAGCGLFPPKEDVTLAEYVSASWRGRPVGEMQAHPVFSMLKAEQQDLPDGSSIVHHMRCTDWQDTQQNGAGVGLFNGNALISQGTQSSQHGQVCCDRQFVVRAGVIQEYRQVPMGGTCELEKRFADTGSAAPTATAAAPAK